MTTAEMLLAIGLIVWIDVLLSGDNAIVIAMACRNLGDKKRIGMILGAGAAVALRVACTGAVAWLMELPYLKMIGAVMLLVVACRMVIGEDETDNPPTAHAALMWAVGTIVAADIVMSLDNVIAVAAASRGHFGLMVFGLCLSIPLIVAGASVISALLEKVPVLIWMGGALLGWIAGDMFAHDHLFSGSFTPLTSYLVATLGAVLVMAISASCKRSFSNA